MRAAANPGIVAAEDLLEGLLGPVERVSDLVPLFDEREDLGLEIREVGEVWGAQSLALQDREPLLNLVHPRAMNRREVHPRPWVCSQPRSRELAVVDAEVVAEQVDQRDRGRSRSIDQFE